MSGKLITKWPRLSIDGRLLGTVDAACIGLLLVLGVVHIVLVVLGWVYSRVSIPTCEENNPSICIPVLGSSTKDALLGRQNMPSDQHQNDLNS